MVEVFDADSDVPLDNHEKWLEAEKRIRNVFEYLLLLFDLVYADGAPLKILEWQHGLKEKLTQITQGSNQCLAYSICIFGTTDPKTSPIIDFSGEFSIEASLLAKIEDLKGVLDFDISKYLR